MESSPQRYPPQRQADAVVLGLAIDGNHNVCSFGLGRCFPSRWCESCVEPFIGIDMARTQHSSLRAGYGAGLGLVSLLN